MPGEPAAPRRRADAQRNRERILAAAREAFGELDGDVSMAEVARRAGVGMATLYRNFPGRQELLEALYADEVDALCEAARSADGDTSGQRLETWLGRFFDYFTGKRAIASALLEHVSGDDDVFDSNRARVLAAGQSLLAAAQQSGEVRDDVTLEQVLDLTIAVAKMPGETKYIETLLRVALDGLRPT
jgi:AcrR family transcriptional regulator